MPEYNKLNLKDDVEDQAPNFGLAPDLEARMARVPLELEGFGVSYQRVAPNFRIPFAHKHKQQAKARARERGKAQKVARRKNR